MHRDANGCSRRRKVITGLHACGMGAFPRLDGHIQMTGRIGDLAQHR
jgi:hypothetical protein